MATARGQDLGVGAGPRTVDWMVERMRGGATDVSVDVPASGGTRHHDRADAVPGSGTGGGDRIVA